MLKTIALICAAAVDHSACSPANAIYVFAFPPERTMICGLSGEATVARMALKPEWGKSYLKVVCERVREAAR